MVVYPLLPGFQRFPWWFSPLERCQFFPIVISDRDGNIPAWQVNTNGSQTHNLLGYLSAKTLSPNGFYQILLVFFSAFFLYAFAICFFNFRSVCWSEKYLHKLSRQDSFPVSCEATATPLDDFFIKSHGAFLK